MFHVSPVLFMFPWCYLFCIVKKNLLCVVLRVDISEQHSAGSATMIIIIVVKV
jgi:hypothetical protein